MIRSSDIVIIGQSRWDNPYSSPAFCLAKEFSKDNRVFYIDHPFSLKDFITGYSKGSLIKSRLSSLLFGRKKFRKVKGLSNNFTVITPKLTLPINWLKQGIWYDMFSKLNDRVVHSALKKAIKRFDIKDYIFINSFDPFFLRSFPKQIAPKIRVYQTIDDITQEAYIARHGVRLEKEAIKNSDINFATSKELTNLMSKYSNNVYYLPNAADFSLFQEAINKKLNCPKEVEGVTQKIICYTGVIGTRINYNLLRKVAIHHSDKLLLMVGPLDSNGYKKASLDELPNVLFTGGKIISELPAYLQYCSCAIIPFEYSVLTKSIYPLKINEYLTAGKPVVTTAFSEDIREFNDVAYISETEDDFLNNIEKAIVEDSLEKKAQRIQKAATNTWEVRVKTFWESINQMYMKK